MDRYVSWHPETRGNGYHCLLSYLDQQWFLHVPPFSPVGWILMMIYTEKANAVVVVPGWSTTVVPAVATDDQPGSIVFLAVIKKFDIATQNLQVPPAMQKKTKTKNCS